MALPASPQALSTAWLSQALDRCSAARPLLRRQPTGRHQRILAQQADERTEAEWREMLKNANLELLVSGRAPSPEEDPGIFYIARPLVPPVGMTNATRSVA